jgi:ribonuclease HI
MVHSNSLLIFTRLTILSKIDYGLQIYSKCSKTNLNKISAPYHEAIRRSLRALKTTPTKNLLSEGGFLSLKSRAEYLTSQLVHKTFSSPTDISHKELNLLKRRKKTLKKPSTLSIALGMRNDFLFNATGPIKNTVTYKTKSPPWLLKKEYFIDTLATFRKETTCNQTYVQHFKEITEKFKQMNWKMIFTDGSKNENGIGFAIVKNDPSQLLCNGLLPPWANIFEAETLAIIKSLEIVKSLKGKYIIITDSLSVFNAARNTNTKAELIIQIQQLLINLNNKVKLMWSPGHAGIEGNEKADQEAKNATKSPLQTCIPMTIRSIKKLCAQSFYTKENQKWMSYNHFYKEVNPQGTAPKYPTSTTTNMNKCFIRLRLGHTLTTHDYIFKKEPPPICPNCRNTQLNVAHIFDCPSNSTLKISIFANKTCKEILSDISPNNIKNVYHFLQKLNIHKNI